MARGILGKSRSPPQSQGISQPVLNYTDALPRNDLREIQPGVSYSRPMHQVVKYEQRPPALGVRNVKRKTETPAAGFDFQITASSTNVVLPAETGLGVDESMIGIALGSPRLLEPRTGATRRNPPPTPPDELPSAALQRKSSKWRKIGGLFKAKSAIAPPVNKPFYQVRGEAEGPSQGSSHSIDYKTRRRAGSKAAPIENTEVWPCLASENEAIARQQESKPKASGTLLQVEIPTVEMERYSVMFGGLLNDGRPSLLNRRSKTLDDVTIPPREPSSPPLMPPRRRATSPTRSNSPNFTLFPAMPASKASKVLGTQNLPQAPDTLRRAQTPLRDLVDPTEEKVPTEKTLKADDNSKASHRPQASVTSFLSSTSIGSDDEPLLIHKIERVRTFAGMQEPDWEIINRKTATPPVPEQLPLKKLTINTREIRSESNSSNSTTQTTATADSRSSSPILSPLPVTNTRPDFPPPSLNINLKSNPIFPQRTVSMKPPPPTDASTDAPDDIIVPTIEVSIARSVSVSKGRKQMLVPVRTRTGPSHRQHHLGADERFVERRRQAKTVTVQGGSLGHRPGVSQDARIELA
ncbi:hypothetical protein BJY04DRAFT_197252 [Aspergillus karnatakaensis]|uniref:uncharacterized protein n=1 Tax=Aspergillus karnatakaensis TaxID=1810916 RepID=UPI003CCE4B6F